MKLPGSLRELLAVTIAGVAFVVYFTFPLAVRPGSLGRIDSGDGQFSIWNVAWVAHAMLSPDVSVLNANIFYPHRGTLAYSEANLGAGVLAVPAYWATRNPFLAHNSAVLIGLTFSFLGMYLLARRISGSRSGAMVAAVAFAFCPYWFSHTAHIQLLMTAPLPFALFSFHRMVDEPTVPRAILVGVSLAVQALFCAYYGVLAGLVVAAGVLFFSVSRRRWTSPRWWGLAILAAGVSVLLVLPFFLPYLDLQRDRGFGRTLQEARNYSADWQSYLASSARMHTWMLKYLGSWKEVLFPGFVATGLAIVGTVAGLKQRGVRPPSDLREGTVFYLLIGGLAFWSSFGPAAVLYAVLYETVPVFSLLRAPARFGLAVVLAVAALAAIGVAALTASQPASRRRWIGAVAVVLMIVDLSTGTPFHATPPFPRADEVLAQSPRGVVVEFPFYYVPPEYHRHTRYMLNSTIHWMPLVNGYSDFIPADFVELAGHVAAFPTPAGFAVLRQRRARYVIFHLSRYSLPDREGLIDRLKAYNPYLRPLVKEGDVWLFEIVRWPDGLADASQLAPGLRGDTRTTAGP